MDDLWEIEVYDTYWKDTSIMIISTALSIAGFLFLSSKIFSFIRLLVSLFILPGKPVSPSPPPL